MRKLRDSPYLWLVTAFLCALFLLMLTIVSYEILLYSPLPTTSAMSTALADALEESDGPIVFIKGLEIPVDLFLFVCRFHMPAGLILGGCLGRALYLWNRAEKRSVRTAKKLTICGSLLVLLGFGYLTSNIYSGLGVQGLWLAIPFIGYPLFFALVLFLWGLHLPQPKAKLGVETQSPR